MANQKMLEHGFIRLPFTKKPVKMPIFERPEYREDLGFVNSSRAVYDTFRAYSKADREFLCVIYLDAKNQVLEVIEAAEGTVDSANAYPREIMKAALILGAASIVLFHNHPSGDPEPSLCDKEITKEIIFAGMVLQVKVLDHVVLGRNSYFSFSDRGLIEDMGLAWTALRNA